MKADSIFSTLADRNNRQIVVYISVSIFFFRSRGSDTPLFDPTGNGNGSHDYLNCPEMILARSLRGISQDLLTYILFYSFCSLFKQLFFRYPFQYEHPDINTFG